MNKFILPQDGKYFEFTTNDLYNIQTNLIESLNSLYKGLSFYGSYIVYGCSLTQVNTDVVLSEGAIFVNGEFYKVDQTTVSVIQGFYFDVVESFDQTGLKVFLDGSTGQTRLVRKGVLNQSSIVLSGFQYSGMKNLNSDIINFLPDATTVSKGVVQLASDSDVLNRTSTTKTITPSQIPLFLPPTKTYIIDLGAWDMLTDASKQFNLSYTHDPSKLVSVTCTIKADNRESSDFFNFPNNVELRAGTFYFNSPTTIQLLRTPGGSYEDSRWSATVSTRGILKIEVLL